MQIVQVQATGAKNKKTSRCKLCKYRQLVPRTRKQADANCASTGNWCQEQENKPMQIPQVQATGAKKTYNLCQVQENPTTEKHQQWKKMKLEKVNKPGS